MSTVTDANNELTLQLYANPVLVQDKVLSLFESHVFDGKQVLDGNNVFTFGLEMEATLIASIVNEMTNSFESLYPQRAQTMQDLYRHMSDYDFVGMFATPATTKIGLLLDRNWVIDNAVPLPDNPNAALIRIPSYSTFSISDLNFGMYYPINIEIRKKLTEDGYVDYENTLIHCQWDDTIKNPLRKLTSNVIEHRLTSTKNTTYICLEIPIYQFENRILKEDAVSSTGFIKRYDYVDYFYAARVFHWNNRTWNELPVTLSDVVYNPDKPTAKVKVLSDIAQIEVSIPQVYFSEGAIGNRIMTMLYTTKGNVTMDLRGLASDQYRASFLVNDEILDPTYSAMLKRIPTILVLPLSQAVTGGKNAYSLAAAKNRIINSAGSDDVLVTNEQVAEYLKELGFESTKYIDNITDRIFVAKREIVNQNQITVASALYKTIITENMLRRINEYDCINIIGDGSSFMLLPNAVFRYDLDTDSMVLLSTDDKKTLSNLPIDQKLDKLNTLNYMTTPFHVKITTDDELPVAVAYNLFSPTVKDISFITDNPNTSTQISIYGINVEHLSDGIGGYKVTIALYKTSDLYGVPPAVASPTLRRNMTAILRVKNKSGSNCFIEGRYEGTNTSGFDLLSFEIQTDYDIDNDEYFVTDSMTLVNQSAVMDASRNRIPLNGTWDVLFFVRTQHVPEKEAASVKVIGVPKNIQDEDMIFVAQQQITLSFGYPIPALRNNIFTTIEGSKYMTHSTTEFAVYGKDTYERFYRKGENGVNYTDYKVPDDYTIPENSPYEIVEKEDGPYIRVVYADGDLVFNPITMQLNMQHKEGELILATPDGESMSDKKTPAMRITTVDAEGHNVDEVLYESPDTLTASPSMTMKFVPYYLNSENEPVFTGKSKIEIADYLKTIIDVVDNVTFETVRNIRRNFVKVGTKYLFEGVDRPFAFVNDVADDTTTAPDYKVIIVPETTDTNGGVETVTRYTYALLRMTDTSTLSDVIKDHDSIVLPNDSIQRNYTHTNTYGCLYALDYDILKYDYTADIDEANLFSFYTDYDNAGGYDSAMLNTYGITAAVAKKLLKLRFPWKKVCYAGAWWCITNYYSTRSLMNFNSHLAIGTAMGTEALAYLQRLMSNVSTIERLPNLQEAIAFANNPANADQLVWCANYNVEEDDSYSPQNQDNFEEFAPLVNLGNLKSGALLLLDVNYTERHLVVATGDSLTECVDAVMSFGTLSGSCFIRTVYANVPESIAQLDSDENVVARYYKVINEDIDLNKNTCYDCANWPWEQQGWVSNTGSTDIMDKIEMRIDKDNTYAQIVHERGDIIISSTGSPVVEGDPDKRRLMYTLELIMFDYKPIATTTNTREEYVQWVRSLVSSYCDSVITARSSMLERTRVYYAPIRTFGLGDFKAPNGDIFTHNLEISLGFKLRVPISVIRDSTAKAIIRNNVLSIIRKHLSTGKLNCIDVANEIKSTLSDNVYYVDILGIDGDPTLQTLISANSAISKPYLKTILSIDSNNDIIETEALTLDYETFI